MVDDSVEFTPGGKLSLPVANGGERNYHQKWPTDTSILDKEGEREGGWRKGGSEVGKRGREKREREGGNRENR